MARPRAFNNDGSPKGHAARLPDRTVPPRPAAKRQQPDNPYALRPPQRPEAGDEAAGIPAHRLKPGANPNTPDAARLPSQATTPEQPTPVKPPPSTGKLKSAGVESHARSAAVGQTTLFEGGSGFSDSTAFVVAALAVTLGALGLFTFGLFGGVAPVTVGVIAALVLALLVFAVMLDRLDNTAAMLIGLGVLLVAGLVMWAVSDDDAARQIAPAGDPDIYQGTPGYEYGPDYDSYAPPAPADPD